MADAIAEAEFATLLLGSCLGNRYRGRQPVSNRNAASEPFDPHRVRPRHNRRLGRSGRDCDGCGRVRHEHPGGRGDTSPGSQAPSTLAVALPGRIEPPGGLRTQPACPAAWPRLFGSVARRLLGFVGISGKCVSFPESFVPKAFSIIFGGVAAATVTAAPIGSYLGSIIGWRGVFIVAAAFAAIAFAWQFLTLPTMPQRGVAR